ncbi:putative exported protein [Candidatus Nitrotoga sp. HW29]|uniref:YhdP family protein n=1 Tax=Candidatus Nitrotoga sp. HW29 TaxID=2886963 RepID=UPI001FA408A6|nr:putative exported protein [Candidatus Nitrotoga sp. HW29]
MLRVCLRFCGRCCNQFIRFALLSAVLLLLVGGGLLLILRYWILPDIEHYHENITTMVSHVVGQPVTIGKIEADWHGIRPHLLFSDVLILDKQGQILLALQRVDNVVSWMTALTGQVRLDSLEINQPNLLIRRDAQGLLYVAGMKMSSNIPGQPADHGLADWLLHQKHIVVRDARITWQDEQRAAPPLLLNQVNIHIENSGRRHRFSLRAQPPAELSAQLDLRGNFLGASFDNFNAWRGELYTQLDYIDVAAWNTWLPLPISPQRGRGALRGWLGVENGKINQFTADLVLADVQTQLADDLPLLDVIKLRGRVEWHDVARGFEISTRKLSLHINNDLMLQPIDLYMRFADATGKQPASGAVRVNTLDIDRFTSLMHYLPLAPSVKQHLAQFAPQGRISDVQAKWQGNFDKLLNYDIKARFDGLSIRRTDNVPGFTRLSGQVDGNDTNGTLSLNTRNFSVDAPLIMPEPLIFDSLIAQLSWQKHDRGMEVKFNKVSVANADLAGIFFGSYQSLPESPGLIDLTVRLTRAAVQHTARYIPLVALNSEAHNWIRDALIGGHADDFNLRLQGNLNNFPFDKNRNGLFQIRARATGVTVEYAKDWPRVENAVAKLAIQGKRLEVTAPTAMTAGGPVKNISVVLPDIKSPGLLLQVRGESVGETKHGLNFIQQSPVRGYIDGFTDDMTSSGIGNLSLHVDIPLRGTKPAMVSGRYHFLDNEVSLGKNIPILHKVNGDLLFSESSLRTENITMQVLGGPATLALQSNKAGATNAKIVGRANIDALHEVAPHSLLNYLHGSSDWESNITVLKKQISMQLTSNLVGLTSDLPAPFAKRASEIIPLRFEMNSMTPQQDLLSVQYGKLLSAKFLRWDEGGERVIKRGTVNFGNAGKWLEKDGVWLVGTIPQLSMEGWGVLAGASDGLTPVSIAGADLLIQKISGYGYMADDLRVIARNVNGTIAAQLAAKSVNGEVSWQPQGNGKFAARLKSLSLELDRDDSGKKKNTITQVIAIKKNLASMKRPALDVAVNSLTLNGKNLGKFELLAKQHERDWLLERLNITNPDGELTADGKWQVTPNGEQTQVNLTLEISDAGKVLGRFGYPNSVKDGSGKLEGAFSWPGAPAEFSYATLDGTLKLDTGKGQFLRIDPGIGKLLSILSLQALPKRITLDFTDVFSAGFKFDNINGVAQVKNGMLFTDDFKIEGSAAKVTMRGQVDLNQETQNLRVRILPTVGNTASLLSAFAAGPVVGIGVFIANKILREPLDKLASFEYNITGAWADPNVEKVGVSKSVAPP